MIGWLFCAFGTCFRGHESNVERLVKQISSFMSARASVLKHTRKGRL